MKTKHPQLFCVYTETTRIIHDDYGHDGDYTGSTESASDSSLVRVCEEHPESYLNELVDVKDLKLGDKLPKDLYAVVVIYSTGGTFSHDSGKLAIQGLYAELDNAKKAATKVKEGKQDKNSYQPWEGYFESVEDVYIQCEEVNKPAKIIRV